MKKKKVPLLKISGDSSIYFDFKKNVPYIQRFVGPYTEKSMGRYSKSTTFWLGQALLGFSALFGIILDAIFTFPVLISIILLLFFGVVGSKIFVRIIITNSLGRREYCCFKKKEIQKAISKPSRFWVLWLTELFCSIGLIFAIMITLSENSLSGRGFIMFGISFFTIPLLHFSVHPRLMLKARKILKKQLKEGKYDE